MPLTHSMMQKRSGFHVSQQPPGWVVKGYGDESFSGEYVTVENALSVAAVLSAFTILMEDTSSLPLITYRRLERGKERDVNNPLYVLLHDMPNPEHTSMVYREFIMGHLLGWGNHFSQKIWDKRGILRELWPLRPDRMVVSRKDGQRIYTYTEQNGNKRIFRQEEIWHIPAFGFDGLVGYSRITLARNAIGLSMAAEKYGSKFFANDATNGTIYRHPGQLGDVAYGRLKESINEHATVENSHKPIILEDGMSIERLGIPPDDAQFIETRKFQLGEIARMFRVPGHLIGDLDRSTSWGTGIEQQELGYLSHTLRPWLKRIEQGAQKDLLLDKERKSIVIEHLVEDFLRTDTTARMAAYVQAIQNGIMTRNEARERENMNPIDGLDEVLMPLNMTTVGADGDGSGDDVSDDSTPLDGDGSSPDPSSSDRNAKINRDFAPFVLDMSQRIAKREANEVSDSAKRWLEKGKPERFLAWLEQFYKRDHADFMLKTLAPLAKIAPETVTNVVKNYLEVQGEKVFRAFQDGDDLHELTKGWLDELPEQITNDLIGINSRGVSYG